jgi:hypothetical protein
MSNRLELSVHPDTKGVEKTATAGNNGAHSPRCLVYFDGTIQDRKRIIIIVVFKAIPQKLLLIFCKYAVIAFNPISE